MRRFHGATGGRLAGMIATLGGTGNAPWASGTVASMVSALILYPLHRCHPALWGVVLAMGILSVIAGGAHAARLRVRDPHSVVIDEAFGMGLAMVLAPARPGGLAGLAAIFVLFRIFDVVKPPPLRSLERLPGGYGITADDLGAALYSAAFLWLTGPIW
jgi:phosphatidylglycerophosphatase A